MNNLGDGQWIQSDNWPKVPATRRLTRARVEGCEWGASVGVGVWARVSHRRKSCQSASVRLSYGVSIARACYGVAATRELVTALAEAGDHTPHVPGKGVGDDRGRQI